jgi:cyclic beta-1,2-glucan synthetase
MKPFGLWRNFTRYFSPRKTFQSDDEPAAGEIFSPERLQILAAELASRHKVSPLIPSRDDLLARLDDNQQQLSFVYESLGEALTEDRQLTPAAEWLIDNFHVVEEQLREVREDLPRGFYRELPKLAGGKFAGVPRIYHLAFELITHTDNRLDKTTLKAFLEEYQQGAPLTMGEIWAFPISLRLALIENLRRFAVYMLRARTMRARADRLAKIWLQVTDENFSGTLASLSEDLNASLEDKNFIPSFSVEFGRRLQDGNRFMSFALETLENFLRREGKTLENLTHQEHRRQAAAQVSVANIITSMRLLSTLDWGDFFESVSLVDRTLREDPAGAYARMDFETRDLYRHHIERIAKQTKKGEIEIARRAVEIAARGAESKKERHVGYYLINPAGLAKFEKEFNYRPTVRESVERFLRRNPTAFYLSTILALTLLLVALFALFWIRTASLTTNLSTILLSVLAVFIVFIPASELAIAITNRLVNFLIKPQTLPKMNFENGIPPAARGMVVIPTLLTDETAIAELCSRLEVCHLASRDRQLYFALLGDLPDAEAETMPEDEFLRQTARERIAELNHKYATKQDAPRFFFFSRRRAFNAGENAWICCERKRGNLTELNRLLRGAQESDFVFDEKPDFEFLRSVRYVITLDADTQMPRDAARKLIGIIEHPLNRPVFEADKGRVVSGYGILQPRIEINLVSGRRTPFARILSAAKGFDPYTTAVSDVYQDLFGEGIYVGKGLYDVDAFAASLEGRIPENRLLSHDLFEGLFARAALVTNIAFYDDYPASYEAFSHRRHRWTRGDWQIARWLLPVVPVAGGKRVRNDLPLIARWKIFDNLRRSLLAVALVACLIFGWALAFLSPLASTVFVLLVLTSQLFLQITEIDFSNFKKTPGFWKGFRFILYNLAANLKTSASQIFLRLVFLADEVVEMLDAVTRTLFRLAVSKKKRLEWVTAAQIDRQSKNKFTGYLRLMSVSFAGTVAAAVLILLFAPRGNFLFAAPFLGLWLIAPLAAFRLSLVPASENGQELSETDKEWLRLVARRTWRYFETFVGQSDHWLPPDNFQQDPAPLVAHRTSPTNIGLLLLATLSARDFGFIGTLEAVERFELTFSTLERLTRFRGHFYNWYDTHTLEPLNPQYISTVDSGNLAGHLITLAEGCQEMARAPLFCEKTLSGLIDTLAPLQQEIKRLRKQPELNDAALKRLADETEKCRQTLSKPMPPDFEAWKALFDDLWEHASEIVESVGKIQDKHGETAAEAGFWATSFRSLVKNLQRDLETLVPVGVAPELHEKYEEMRKYFVVRLNSIAAFCRRLADEMDFKFLYDDERKVLTIGYRPAENVNDNSFYDLLASEARLASFIAVATGDVEQEHWFRLGRGLVSANGSRALVSWSGTMFEYLMPQLVMREYANTLLAETSRSIIGAQIEYGNQHGVPWGVSESAYNARDLQLNYQYAPFGVPGLGLKRGLADDLVVAPYASVLAAQIEPFAAIANLRKLAADGMFGKYGFFEAVDYTKKRLPPGQTSAKIEAFMTHHQGMISVALDNLLNDYAMQDRFHRSPVIESAELLLQERVPQQTGTIAHPRAMKVVSSTPAAFSLVLPRRFDSADQFSPHVCLLSNGSYTVMLTNAGSGFSRCRALAVTRWREDAVRDNWGQFIYLCDSHSGAVWSSGLQPVLREPQEYEVFFTETKADFRRREVGILTHTEIIVSAEDDAELRRVTITNESTRAREIGVWSYGEIVLTTQAADEAHAAFSNLFVETEFVEAKNIILATRRQRSNEESEIWGAHTVTVAGKQRGEIKAETSRAAFLGRGGTVQNPEAIANNTHGLNQNEPALDSIFSLGVSLMIEPGESASVTFSTIIAKTREAAIEIAEKYNTPDAFERAAQLAWTRSQVELRHLKVSGDEANLFQRLAGQLIFADATLRPRAEILRLNTGTQKDLWKYGIGGDLPMLLARVSETGDALRQLRLLIKAHEYLRAKNLIFDLIVLNDQPVTYAQNFNEDLQMVARGGATEPHFDKAGGIYLRRADIMPENDRITLHTAARVCFVTGRGSLEEQLVRQIKRENLPPPLSPRETPRLYPKIEEKTEPLLFPNEFGGFSAETSEYVITLETAENLPPAPWSNVIANENDFGFLATEAGMGVTWSQNSRENRLTPWSNDAVTDAPAEVIYLRDEMTGSFWSPTALPVRDSSPYIVRHGQGYTIYEHASHGIEQELLLFAALRENVKILRLRLKNCSDQKRKISVTHYAELVLGVNRAETMPFIITEIDAATGAIFARNPYNNEFAARVAFAATDSDSRTWTCDRREFIGRNGSLARPVAMLRQNLSGAAGAGLDACFALQTGIEIEPDETKEIVFLLGEESSADRAREIVSRFRQTSKVEAEFHEIRRFWNDLLTTIQVKTPDAATDALMNRWLIYQTLACRFWGRTSQYQSSGAFGFRDQLQDATALIYSSPQLARAHILRAAAHQFKEGDVLHWWHEPVGRGSRTRSSDDLLWLPYVVSFYLKVTGDETVLDEVVPFIEAILLGENQDEAYLEPIVSLEKGSIYEHCLRAVERSLAIGERGLPLIGSGDWSDGLTRVGNRGRGESVWLGWFLADILVDFSEICRRRGDQTRARRYQKHVKTLQKNLDSSGWDGEWFRRAYFDDGTPLGSRESDECKIDAIAQSWSVISEIGNRGKAEQAMRAVEDYLVLKEKKLSLLLAPPFDKTPLDPGYIKGYQPGVRENGGQYTHAAAWNVIALAMLGEGDRAFEIFRYLNPINHTLNAEEIALYKTEPYAVAADIYAGKFTGRGGWTWYTGAAGWIYRAMLEYILGFKKRGAELSVETLHPARLARV